jgi:hypothetical protein
MAGVFVKSVIVVAVAGAGAAWALPASSEAATPRPISVACTFEKGVVVVVEPRRRRAVITDAGRTMDQYGQAIQDPSSNRLVGTMTSSGLTAFGCRRVEPRRTALRTSHLTGPWTSRVFSRVLCGFYGKDMRLDLTPLKGGGYRLTVTSPLAARSPFVSVDLRPRNRGGISFNIEICLRLAK